MPFKPGQQWISRAEPELGMGRVVRVEHRLVHCFFELSHAERTYSRDQAPLVRARFGPGDEVRTRDGIAIAVRTVAEKDGILIYHGSYRGTNTAVVETELDPRVRFSKPEERLLTGQIDDNGWFNHRHDTLSHRARLATAPARGLCGPRVSLIPHQLYIASEVATRFAPRVLLADEVGLGKTIEAGLIVHQQLHTGAASRVLVIVPPALRFQWFVEMIRRFNLHFILMDENRAAQIQNDNAPVAGGDLDADGVDRYDEPGVLANPFEAQQLVICSLSLFTGSALRLEQAAAAEWDLVVVDEAHHLAWSPGAASAEYAAIEQIAARCRGLLLLTATPEQLGRDGHFARLRLLDPDRFHDLSAFLADESGFEGVARAVRDLLDGDDDARRQARDVIARRLGIEGEVPADLQLVRLLLDRHGTGRVFFRNVRSSVAGFPVREPLPVSLPKPGYANLRDFFPERRADDTWPATDARVAWLIATLEASRDKFLVICAHQETATALEAHLRTTTAIRVAAFVEDMDLIARDRAATYFAETNRGAQALVCSEIGSEGRNFQFASNLVLFDLPLSADLLEQRIGRLDRIGQKNAVRIHVPLLGETAQADLYRWYDEGLDLFRQPNAAGQSLFDELFARFGTGSLQALIDETRDRNAARRVEMQLGRDRLIEINSHDTTRSAAIVAGVRAATSDPSLEAYMEASFDLFGLESEPLGDQVFSVKPTESTVRHFSASLETLDHYHYPELPDDGIQFSYDRDTALAREDIAFLTWESPLVEQAMDVMLTDVTGNSAMVAVKRRNLPAGTLLLEALFVAECQAPASVDPTRFMPPTVLRVVMTPGGDDIAGVLPFDPFDDRLDIPQDTLAGIVQSQQQGIRRLIALARAKAGEALTALRDEAATGMRTGLDYEIARLEGLARINPNVRADEIGHLVTMKATLQDAIDAAAMRLDAIRVIVAA